MEKLYEWVRQIAYVMVLISVIMQLAAGKQYQKYIRLYTGIVLILFMLVPVFRIFGTDTTGFMTEAEKKYNHTAAQFYDSMLPLSSLPLWHTLPLVLFCLYPTAPFE